jgi:methionine-rich copper-binding protein CopC
MIKKSIIAFSLLGVIAASPLWAHAKLQSSVPANHAQLSEAPKTLTLQFNEAAKLALVKLIADGKEISVPIDKNAKPSQSFTVNLPGLAAGTYTVQWTAVAADDGHVTKGTFDFTITGG